MAVRDGVRYPSQEITVLFNSGGFGDAIARLPALRVIERDYPHCQVHLYVLEALHPVFERVLKRTKLYPFPPKGEASERPGYYFGKGNFHTTMGTHLVDHAFTVLVDRTNVPIEDKNYPRLPELAAERERFKLPKRYVVLTPGYTSAVREMLPEVVNGIANWLNTISYTPVFLGSKTEHIDTSANFDQAIDYGLGVDLRNKTTLLEAAAIIQGARAIVGLDNGLIHLAGMTETPIVVGYSTQLPELRMPIRDGVLGKGCYVVQPKTCFGCEPEIRFNYNHDFRTCYLGDKRCLKEMPAEAYTKQLMKALTSV